MVALTSVQMIAILGKGCAMKVLGLSLGLLAAAACTGGAALAIAGAYLPDG